MGAGGGQHPWPVAPRDFPLHRLRRNHPHTSVQEALETPSIATSNRNAKSTLDRFTWFTFPTEEWLFKYIWIIIRGKPNKPSI